MYCPKCGTENDEDAKYCQKCGLILKKDMHKRNIPRNEKNEGMSKTVKGLIIACVILIAGIGVAAGMLLTNPSTNTTIYQVAPNTASQTPTTQQYQATWHEIATYTGPGEVNSAFSIRGSQFKVTMSAVPMITYNTNYLDVGVASGNYLVGRGSLSWTSNENPNKKEAVIPVSQGSGSYSIGIVPTDIESYRVTVWDYY